MQSLVFDNAFTRDLPADSQSGSERRQVRGALFSRVEPTTVAAPYLIHSSAQVAQLLGLSEADRGSEDFLQVFAGNKLLPGMDAHATCYGGHQFGNWAGQLGDGRAINLGEVKTATGHLMLQLKGAGETPYSRTADGLAVLRSSLREYVCSEAMFHLGVPTTRALSLIGTGEQVMRDMLYDGHPALEPGAVVCRVSSSFVRFGHFQMLAARQETELLETFTNFVIEREFPAIATAHQDPIERYLAWFARVCQRTATLMVQWMRVGFVHGVMNTDNLSILGETIDYGPYGWLEGFDPDWTPNTTDAGQRRYRFAQQPAIAQWNLLQLANALYPLVKESKPLEEILGNYATTYEHQWQNMMANKLGLPTYDADLTNRLLQLLTETETDMTLFFRHLADVKDPTTDAVFLQDAYYAPRQISQALRQQTQQWLSDYLHTAEQQNQSHSPRAQLMNRTNPLYVPRNYLAQLAIDAAEQG
ncbi:MAG: YdiU family protein, partial [OM182 bacterium]